MPITGPASFIPTTDEFLGHWQTADSELGVGNELVLGDGTTRAGLLAKRNELETLRNIVTTTLTDQELNREEIESQKTLLLVRANQFNDLIRADYVGTKWERVLKDVPKQNDGQSTFIDPLIATAHLWLRLNAAISPAPPRTLLGGYMQGAFKDHIDALSAAYPVWTESTNDTRFAREDRNDMQDVVYEILKAYRKKLLTRFAEGNAVLDSQPRLTPEPGSTPTGVTINGGWSVPEQAGEVNFAASPDDDIELYRVVMVPGPDFNDDDATVVGTIAAGVGPFQFFTTAALTVAGNIVSIKVITVNATGNEKSSNVITITRPDDPTPP